MSKKVTKFVSIAFSALKFPSLVMRRFFVLLLSPGRHLSYGSLFQGDGGRV